MIFLRRISRLSGITAARRSCFLGERVIPSRREPDKYFKQRSIVFRAQRGRTVESRIRRQKTRTGTINFSDTYRECESQPDFRQLYVNERYRSSDLLKLIDRDVTLRTLFHTPHSC